MSILQKFIWKLRRTAFSKGSLEGKGERVDIRYDGKVDFAKFDMYQRSHYRRYEFACKAMTPGSVCGDFACGTGYGSVMLAQQCAQVVGVEINSDVVEAVRQRYKEIPNVEFVNANLLDLAYDANFDAIVSFETLEHFSEDNIPVLLHIIGQALKSGGQFVFSTPYMQARSEAALKMGFHQTFNINEPVIEEWLDQSGFEIETQLYQNYQTHALESVLEHKDFIVCVARKRA